MRVGEIGYCGTPISLFRRPPPPGRGGPIRSPDFSRQVGWPPAGFATDLPTKVAVSRLTSLTE